LYSAIKIIRDNSVSIDSVATSETSFTLSLKESDFTTKIKNELYELDNNFSITIDTKVTKISIV
jgi:aspartokinase